MTPDPPDSPGSRVPAASRAWDVYYQTGRYRQEWHLDHASPELLALLAAGVVVPCRALDLGCGAGTEAVHLASEGFAVTALDVSAEALALTRRAAARAGVEVATVQAFVPDTGLPDAAFEFVNDRSCFHCIEPTRENLEAYAAEARRLLTPGGILFVRRFGQPQIDRSMFERVFAGGFDLGRVQEVPFREPHMPSRVAVLRRTGPERSAE